MVIDAWQILTHHQLTDFMRLYQIHTEERLSKEGFSINTE